jgi:hypothetical protein
MTTTLRHKYNVQRLTAIKRNIDWQFTYDSWIEWWGEDIVNRGKLKGQLVMARYNDVGPYHPDNVRKAPTGDNVREAHAGKPKGDSNSLNKILITCPHCKTTTNRGNAKQWHFDNCKEKHI